MDWGRFFRISASGEFEVLFNFDGANGSVPHAGLIQANDGNFYGVTYRGGEGNQGVVFKMTPMHEVTVLHDFTGGSDGSGPIGRLLQGTDGNLYGTTYYGGTSGGGVLFRISSTGQFTTLHRFEPSTGANPIALIQHTNGFLYGDTFSGGLEGRGVLFRFDLGLPPFVTYLPSYGRVGMTVDILAQYLTPDRNKGLPCVGLNGTVVVCPHAEQVTGVSLRIRVPRLALQALQCLGSFTNCFSWKKSCSPAVKTNSTLQSIHLRILSANSIVSFCPGLISV